MLQISYQTKRVKDQKNEIEFTFSSLAILAFRASTSVDCPFRALSVVLISSFFFLSRPSAVDKAACSEISSAVISLTYKTLNSLIFSRASLQFKSGISFSLFRQSSSSLALLKFSWSSLLIAFSRSNSDSSIVILYYLSAAKVLNDARSKAWSSNSFSMLITARFNKSNALLL